MNLAVSARHREPLGVSKDAGVLFLGQNPHAPPIGEIARGAGINVVAPRFVKEFRQAQDDADQVVQAALVVSLLHRRGNLVVGLGDDVFYAHHAWVVPQCAEGINSGHALDPAPDIGNLSLRCQLLYSLIPARLYLSRRGHLSLDGRPAPRETTPKRRLESS